MASQTLSSIPGIQVVVPHTQTIGDQLFSAFFFLMVAFIAFRVLRDWLAHRRAEMAWLGHAPGPEFSVTGEFPRLEVKYGRAQYFNVEHAAAKGGTTWSAMYRAKVPPEVVVEPLFWPSLRRRFGRDEFETTVSDPVLRQLILELVRAGLTVSIGGGQLVAEARRAAEPQQVYENLRRIEQLLTRADALGAAR